MGKVVVVFEAIPLGWQALAAGTLWDKTVADKLMYIPNDDKQNFITDSKLNVWAFNLMKQPIKIKLSPQSY